ncbi:MAG: DUF3313 domain-containing protein [Desulfobulbaceae bacterium]|nr:DUF3313 domain-containing protein [Desulfobulbaceae bacterium]
MRKNTWWFVLLLITLFLAGCAASGMKDVKQSGFLGDYSQLKPGADDRAALVYMKPGVDFKKYDSVMFERVTVYLSPEAESQAIDPTMMKELTDYYQTALINAVKDGYKVVDQPGPGVLRVKVAITDMKPSNPTANTMSSIIPVGMVVSAATKATTGDNLGTGEAATEMEFLDALSGERLAAAVDRRQGGKMAFRGKWEDTKQAFDFWSKRFRERLDEARGISK